MQLRTQPITNLEHLFWVRDRYSVATGQFLLNGFNQGEGFSINEIPISLRINLLSGYRGLIAPSGAHISTKSDRAARPKNTTTLDFPSGIGIEVVTVNTVRACSLGFELTSRVGSRCGYIKQLTTDDDLPDIQSVMLGTEWGVKNILRHEHEPPIYWARTSLIGGVFDDSMSVIRPSVDPVVLGYVEWGGPERPPLGADLLPQSPNPF
jgi:hypothetical protein